MTRVEAFLPAGPMLATRRWRVPLALAMAAAWFGAVTDHAQAATGFTYRLVKDFPATSYNGAQGAEEALCNFAFNDVGQAAYTASRLELGPLAQSQVTSVYFWDGQSERLVYREAISGAGTEFPRIGDRGCPAEGIGLDETGLIAVPAYTRLGASNLPVTGALFLRAGAGVVGVVDGPEDSPNSHTRANLNTGGQVAYFRFSSPATGAACFEVGTQGPASGSAAVTPFCLPGDLPGPSGYGGAIVGEGGQAAVVLQHQVVGQGTFTSLLDFDGVGSSRLTDLGPADQWFSQNATPGLNRLGFASLVTDGSVPARAASSFRVALLSPDRQALTLLADETVFTRQAGSISPTWLNDKNQVLVGIRDVDPRFLPALVGQQSLWLLDAARQPLPVFLTSEPFELGGQSVSAPFLPGPASFAPGGGTDLVVNDAGDVMFSAIYEPAGGPAGQQRLGIFVAHPEPGLTPSNPVLPGPLELLPFGWRFTNPCASWRGRTFYPPGSAVPPPQARPCYVDPPIATGYTFTALPGNASFASVLVPAPLPGGDASFTLEVAGRVLPIQAGEPFDLTAIDPAGVVSFRITGIDPAEALSPTDASAFVAGLTWTGPVTGGNSITMVPIADSDDDGVEDAADACPGTGPGASVDARGCSAAQRDTDGDGVSDASDACPGTAPGTSVDMTGCPIAQPAGACDVDRDGDVDRLDLKAILKVLGRRSAGPSDPRDSNHDGRIDLRDAVICTLRCGRPFCAAL